MTLLSTTSPVGQEDDQGSLRKDPAVLFVPGPEDPMWVDLYDPDPTRLEEVRQQLGLSPEVITACFRHSRSSTVTCIDSVLVLGTFFAHLVSHSLFSLQELKICVTPHILLTLHGRVSAGPLLGQQSFLPDWRGVRAGSTGHLLRLLLEGAVRLHERVGVELKKSLPKTAPANNRPPRVEQLRRRRVRKRGMQFVKFLHQQHAFLQDVERAGGTLFCPDDRAHLQWLVERVGVLARILGETVRPPRVGARLLAGGLKAILTEHEKQTALICGWFLSRYFVEVDLSAAVFRKAHLEGTEFVRTDLRGADFRQAELRGAVFSFCDLWGADFTKARLEGADFSTSFGLSPSMWGYIRSHGGVV